MISDEDYSTDGKSLSHNRGSKGSILRVGSRSFPLYPLVIVGLGLLDIILLLTAVVIGINCTKVKEGSSQVSHPTATQLVIELNYLHSNHSHVITTDDEVKKALDIALKNHTQLKVQLEQQRTISDGYQRQIETLQAERTYLMSNISMMEVSCGKCLPGWKIFNSSCYFFSYFESSTVQKNWPDSRADCVRRGADLVVIDNEKEQTFLSTTIKPVSSGTWQSGFWVGLTDKESEGTWVWINNVTEVEERYWMSGEPNNHGFEGEDCAIIVYLHSVPWHTRFDGKCQRHELNWICEMPSR